ncbi:MAG TPA: VOC family protein [Thermoplasmata archaeon]|nr:VOC family protein [Thermoplasmata archaeon]
MDEVIEGMGAVTVHIREIERSRKFYAAVLGLREVSYLPKASRAAFAIPGSSTLLTMHPMGEGEGGREPGTVSGVIFSHHDPVAACAEIRRRGGTIVDEPETFPTALGTVTLGVFADLDGNQFIIRRIHR